MYDVDPNAVVERHESQLGSWVTAGWSPAAGSRLHGSVRKIWYFDGVLVARRERVFPDGSIEIIVQLDEPHRPGDAAEAAAFPPVCVTGLRLVPEVVLAPPGRARVLGVLLSPPCAHRVMRESLESLTGITADLHDVVGRQAAQLAERVSGASSAAAAVMEARAWLCERLDAAGEGRRNFHELFGTTPKRYQRILRFSAALQQLGRDGASLAEIADAHGYYDQAHFTNEFREHAGMTPTQYLRSMSFPGGTNLAE